MNFFFPDRDRLGRDPLEFLLRKAEGASAPVLPLALGFRRNFLVADLSLINEGPFSADSLYMSSSPDDPFAAIAINAETQERLITQPGKVIGADDCTKIIDYITKEALCSLRRSLFSAYRHASFDCWHFSKSIATKLTFVNLFGTDAIGDEQIFSHHAETIHSLRDPISLDIILKNVKDIRSKTQTYKDHVHIARTELLRSPFLSQSMGLLSHVPRSIASREWVVDLAISVSQTTAEALFWAIFALSRNESVRSIVEREADTCLSSDGDLDINRIYDRNSTKNLVLEIFRLAPARTFVIFETNVGFLLRDVVIKPGDKLIICPNIIFRRRNYFYKADEMQLDRKYDPGLAGLQYLACGGRIVFRLVLLNVVLLLLDLAAAFELELVDGPDEFRPTPGFGNVRPDIKVRLNLRRSRLFR